MADIATIYDVAARAGVSPATVSRVLNQTARVNPELRQRVRAAARELHYAPNFAARSLSRQRTHTLGLLLPDIANPFFAEMARGVEDAAAEAGYTLLIGSSDGEVARERRYVESLKAGQVDGVLFAGAHMGAPAVEELVRRRIPVGLLDRLLTKSGSSTVDSKVDMVLTDNVKGGALAVQHLIHLGHTRIAVITGPLGIRTAADRLEGARRGAIAAACPLADELIVEGDFRETGGYEAAGRLFSLPNPPTAIFTENDMMALGVLRRLEELNIRVPEDVAVVGYDDITFAPLLRPPLTTVAQAQYEMGALAAGHLIERVQNPERKVQRELLQPRLVLRETTLVRREIDEAAAASEPIVRADR